MKPAQFSYSAYGLRFCSDRALAGLNQPNGTASHGVDLSIRFERTGDAANDSEGETLWYTSDIQDENGSALKIWKGKSCGDFFVRYSHGLTFRVNARVTSVQVYRLGPMNEADIESFWLGPVLGIVLRLRGVMCLHASAIGLAGKAIAFAGSEGAGKSTSAALFAQNGHSVLTDDIVALSKHGPGYIVHPGHPYLNLLPDSMALIRGKSPTAADEPTWDKIRVVLADGNLRFQSEALPLQAIYILSTPSQRLSTPIVRSLSQQQALVELAANTFANKMLDSKMRADEFAALGLLAKSTTVRLLDVRGCSLKELYRAICDDVMIPTKIAAS